MRGNSKLKLFNVGLKLTKDILEIPIDILEIPSYTRDNSLESNTTGKNPTKNPSRRGTFAERPVTIDGFQSVNL